jgi:two-component system response regulator DesR
MKVADDSTPSTSDAGGAPVRRPRAIIAEDFVLIQESMKILLQRECDVVAVAEDGNAALEAVATHKPDLLLMDISLPGRNGFAIAEELRKADSPVRIIIVTAHRDTTYVDRAFEMGVKGYVMKSCMRAELLPAVRSIMAGGVYRSPLLG